ncbi:MAG: permease [Deltaproteobacteria bacterium]|nr:MAG: permease [Deltaproteobacteria bacterium]
MLIPTIIMGVIAAILVAIGFFRGQGQDVQGIKVAVKLTIEMIPLLLFAFIIAGMMEVLIPSQIISRWIGAESGFRGILIGAMAGSLTPGGPFVSFPIAAGFLRAGAGIGTMVAFVTGWSLWALTRLPLEVGILGWRFTLIRITCTFIFPPLAGLIANFLFRGTLTMM